jgi:hypothetical protein
MIGRCWEDIPTSPKDEKMKSTSMTSNAMAAPADTRKPMIQKALLFCGALSSLFYAAMDVIDGLQWPHYSWISQEFSRLSAIGAPSRAIHLALSPIYALLVIAFGLGVWASSGQRRALKAVGGGLVFYAVIGIFWPWFFPEDLSQTVSAVTNTMHLVLTAMTVLSWMVILTFAARAFGKPFSWYSIGTLLTVLVFGALTAPQGAALAAGQPTPWIGLTERINIYSFMLWAIVLALVIIREQADISRIKEIRS